MNNRMFSFSIITSISLPFCESILLYPKYSNIQLPLIFSKGRFYCRLHDAPSIEHVTLCPNSTIRVLNSSTTTSMPPSREGMCLCPNITIFKYSFLFSKYLHSSILMSNTDNTPSPPAFLPSGVSPSPRQSLPAYRAF